MNEFPVADSTSVSGSFMYDASSLGHQSGGSVAARICGCTLRSAAVAAPTDWSGFSPHHQRQPPRRSAIEVRLLAAQERLAAERHRDVERASDFSAEQLRRRDADDCERHAID